MTTYRYCFDLAAGGLCTFSTVCVLGVPGFPVGTSNWTLMRGLLRAITGSSSSLLLLLSVYPFLSGWLHGGGAATVTSLLDWTSTSSNSESSEELEARFFDSSLSAVGMTDWS